MPLGRRALRSGYQSLIIVAALIGAPDAQRYGVPPVNAGRVDMPTSCKGEAQAEFERGAALLHSFWYDEARHAFTSASDADPDCGMAYWGEAMTWTTPLWDAPTNQALELGLKAAQKARAVGAPTARERAYIEAVVALYDDYQRVSQKDRMARYSERMAHVYRGHPLDKNAAAFYALSLIGLPAGACSAAPAKCGQPPTQASAELYANDVKAADILEREFGKAPDHPGALHYLIHACDNPVYAKRGLPAADKYAAIAPAVPHALHMPSHIYARLGMWDKVAGSNEAAWAASDAHVGRLLLHGGDRDYHSLQWLLYANLQLGRYRRAAEILAVMRAHAGDRRDVADMDASARYHLGDMSARDALERHDWSAAMQAVDGGSLRHGLGTMWYAQGVGAARAAWPGAKTNEIALARAAAAELDALAAREGRRSLAALERLGVLAAIAAAQEEHDELTLLPTEADALEDAMATPGQPAFPVVPIHELAGELWLQLRRYGDAQREFAAALTRYPRRARSLYGLAHAASRAGDAATARTAYAEFAKMWQSADADRPELAEARAYLASSSPQRP